MAKAHFKSNISPPPAKAGGNSKEGYNSKARGNLKDEEHSQDGGNSQAGANSKKSIGLGFSPFNKITNIQKWL